MNDLPNAPSAAPHGAKPDWIDRILAQDAADHTGDYISDSGFTARVMQTLPSVGALPAWRRPAIAMLWGVAGILLAIILPGLAFDIAQGAFRLLAAKPFALSTVASMVVAAGVATWSVAAFVLRKD